MVDYVKIVVKNINQDLLQEEMVAAGVAGGGAYWAGFDKINSRIYAPSTVHGFTEGELRFKYDPGLTVAQETTLDNILATHDATQSSTRQANEATDEIDRQNFVTTFQGWDALTDTQKLNRTKQLFRVVARLVNKQTDI